MAQADPGRAWGWVAALRSGSTTPWSQWPPDAAPAPALDRDLPGAQQLELLRRVNLASAAPRPDLAERILAVGATGRGRPDLELPGTSTSRRWGPEPTDPTDLGAAELLRFVGMLLAEDLAVSGHRELAEEASGAVTSSRAAATLPARARRRLRRRAPGHRLVGDPWLVDPLRQVMLAQGHPLGGSRSAVVVIGTDLVTMLADTYTARAFDDGVAPWHRWLRTGPGDRTLPPRIDLAHVARHWQEEAGHRRVVVVTEPRLATDVLPLRSSAVPDPDQARPSADAVDLARRVAAALGLLVPRQERRALLRGVLLPRLLTDNAQHPAPPLTVPEARTSWVVRQAEQMRDDLLEAGYAVVGDPEALVPRTTDRRGAVPDSSGVLDLAIRLLLTGPGRDHRKAEVEG
ncbi:MAG: hypothetical protein WB471_03025 [Nocardioides sp.]